MGVKTMEAIADRLLDPDIAIEKINEQESGFTKLRPSHDNRSNEDAVNTIQLVESMRNKYKIR